MNLYEILAKHNVIIDGFNYDGLDESLSEKYAYFEKMFNEEYKDYANTFRLKDFLFYINTDLRCNAFCTQIKKVIILFQLLAHM